MYSIKIHYTWNMIYNFFVIRKRHNGKEYAKYKINYRKKGSDVHKVNQVNRGSEAAQLP